MRRNHVLNNVLTISLKYTLYTLYTGACTDDSYLAGAGWELYMGNGYEQQFRESLKFGANPNGYGDITVITTSGAHKMSEALFDTKGFTELLAYHDRT